MHPERNFVLFYLFADTVWEDVSQLVLAMLDRYIWQQAENSGSITGTYLRSSEGCGNKQKPRWGKLAQGFYIGSERQVRSLLFLRRRLWVIISAPKWLKQLWNLLRKVGHKILRRKISKEKKGRQTMFFVFFKQKIGLGLIYFDRWWKPEWSQGHWGFMCDSRTLFNCMAILKEVKGKVIQSAEMYLQGVFILIISAQSCGTNWWCDDIAHRENVTL